MLGVALGIICLIGSIVYFVLKLINKKIIHTEVEQIIKNSEQFSSPCRVRIFRDSSEDTPQMKKWEYAFSLNNGEKKLVNDGDTIEFITCLKDNALVGYGRGGYGGLSRHPSLDSPFRFEAVEGGLIQLIAKPKFDYTGGNVTWRSEISYQAG